MNSTQNMKKLISIFLLFLGIQTSFAQNEFQKGMDALDNNNLEKALEYFNICVNNDPKDASNLFMRSFTYLYLQQLGNALTDINNALKYYNKKFDKTPGRIYSMRAEIYNCLEEYQNAINDYTSALKYLPNNRDCLFQRAKIYYQIENYEASNKDFTTILKNNETDVVALTGIMRNYLNTQNYDQVIELANKAIRLDPEYLEPYYYRAYAHIEKKNFSQAIDDAITYCNSDYDYGIYLLETCAQNSYNLVLNKINQQITQNPQSPEFLIIRASLFETKEEFSKAIEDYNSIENLIGEKTVKVSCYRATCYSELGLYNQAIKDFSDAIEINPEPFIFIRRGEAYRLNAQYDLAIKDFSSIIEKGSEYASQAYYRRGWVKEMLKDYDGALNDYNIGIELDNNYSYLYLMRGELYMLKGDSIKAYQDFNQILQKDTIIEDGSCRQYALFFLGKKKEAKEWMQKLIETNQNLKGHYYDATCLYCRMGELEQALKFLRLSLENGYKAINHILIDDDLDVIKNLPEFQEIINEHLNKTEDSNLFCQKNESKKEVITSEIAMKKLPSGVYEIPCKINNLPLHFIFDTGASNITISSIEATFMLKNGYLKTYDILNTQNYLTASGEIRQGTQIKLKKVSIGDFELNDIEASVVHNQKAPLLLGQSILNKFGKIAIDNKHQKLIITSK